MHEIFLDGDELEELEHAAQVKLVMLDGDICREQDPLRKASLKRSKRHLHGAWTKLVDARRGCE